MEKEKLNLEISKIEIKEEIINALVEQFFKSVEVNLERRKKNVLNEIKYQNKPYSPEGIPLPPLEVKSTYKKLIDVLTIERYFNLFTEIKPIYFKEQPYISLISTNVLNELRVGILSADYSDRKKDVVVELFGVSRWYEAINGKYFFINN